MLSSWNLLETVYQALPIMLANSQKFFPACANIVYALSNALSMPGGTVEYKPKKKIHFRQSSTMAAVSASMKNNEAVKNQLLEEIDKLSAKLDEAKSCPHITDAGIIQSYREMIHSRRQLYRQLVHSS